MAEESNCDNNYLKDLNNLDDLKELNTSTTLNTTATTTTATTTTTTATTTTATTDLTTTATDLADLDDLDKPISKEVLLTEFKDTFDNLTRVTSELKALKGAVLAMDNLSIYNSLTYKKKKLETTLQMMRETMVSYGISEPEYYNQYFKKVADDCAEQLNKKLTLNKE